MNTANPTLLTLTLSVRRQVEGVNRALDVLKAQIKDVEYLVAKIGEIDRPEGSISQPSNTGLPDFILKAIEEVTRNLSCDACVERRKAKH